LGNWTTCPNDQSNLFPFDDSGRNELGTRHSLGADHRRRLLLVYSVLRRERIEAEQRTLRSCGSRLLAWRIFSTPELMLAAPRLPPAWWTPVGESCRRSASP